MLCFRGHHGVGTPSSRAPPAGMEAVWGADRDGDVQARRFGMQSHPSMPAHLSKMAPTPALWALFRCTWSPVARRIPSFTAMERWEKEAIRSSFHPGEEKTTEAAG